MATLESTCSAAASTATAEGMAPPRRRAKPDLDFLVHIFTPCHGGRQPSRLCKLLYFAARSLSHYSGVWALSQQMTGACCVQSSTANICGFKSQLQEGTAKNLCDCACKPAAAGGKFCCMVDGGSNLLAANLAANVFQDSNIKIKSKIYLILLPVPRTLPDAALFTGSRPPRTTLHWWSTPPRAQQRSTQDPGPLIECTGGLSRPRPCDD